jgi:hypothetical protein
MSESGHIASMPVFDLTDDERAALIALLKGTIDRDRFPLSQRIRLLRSILEKLGIRSTLAVTGPPPNPRSRLGAALATRRRLLGGSGLGVRWRSGPSCKKPSGEPQEACSVAAPYRGPYPNPIRPSGARRVAPGCGPSAALARYPGPFFLAMNRRLCRISSAGRVPVLSPAGNSAQLSPYGLHGHRSHVHPSSPHRTAHISLFGSGGNERWNRSFNRNRILA